MTDEQHRHFRQLIDEGYSSLDAADEMGLTDAQREEALDFAYDPDSTNAANDLVSNDLTDIEGSPEPDKLPSTDLTPPTDNGCFTMPISAAASLEAALQHLRDREAQVTRDREAIEAERLAMAEERAGFGQKISQLQADTYEDFRHRGMREKMVSRFTFLLDDLLDNADECRWSGPEVDDYLERCDGLMEKLTKYCNSHRIDERRLVIHQGLTDILRTVGAMQHEQTRGLFAGSSVVIDFGPKTRQRFESYKVTDFLAETPIANVMISDLGDDDDDDND